ncbi:MAG: hypothetical protein ABI155_10800 [Paralcaligenes sp.]
MPAVFRQSAELMLRVWLHAVQVYRAAVLVCTLKDGRRGVPHGSIAARWHRTKTVPGVDLRFYLSIACAAVQNSSLFWRTVKP